MKVVMVGDLVLGLENISSACCVQRVGKVRLARYGLT